MSLTTLPVAVTTALLAALMLQADAPFPTPGSKKGLQVQMVDDALALGVRHAALNVLLGHLIDPEAREGALVWRHGGRTLRLRPERVAALDREVAPLTAAGVVVSLILLGGVTGDPRIDDTLLHPARPAAPPNGLVALDGEDPARAATLAALIDFLAARYDGGEHGRVWGWIVGNEVNSHGAWYAMGDAPPEVVARRYEAAVRVVHGAVAPRSRHARVYVSLEHHFAVAYQPDRPMQSLPGRELLERFALRARERGDFPWHVAFHPYPEDLFDAAFWEDTTAPRCSAPPRITFRNLRELERFLARPALRFEGAPRRVILSEQGFHRRDGAAGELLQAAAYAAAYRLVAACPTIDAFILHRHVDHAREGGLQLGLWTRRADSLADPERATRMRAVFAECDGPGADEALAFALPIVGAASWAAFTRDALDSREVHPGLAHIVSLQRRDAAAAELSLLGLAPASLFWTAEEALPPLVAARATTRSGAEVAVEVALDPATGVVLRLVVPDAAGVGAGEWRPE